MPDTVTKEDAAKAAWVASASCAINAGNRPEMTAVAHVIRKTYENAPDADPVRVKSFVDTVLHEYKRENPSLPGSPDAPFTMDIPSPYEAIEGVFKLSAKWAGPVLGAAAGSLAGPFGAAAGAAVGEALFSKIAEDVVSEGIQWMGRVTAETYSNTYGANAFAAPAMERMAGDFNHSVYQQQELDALCAMARADPTKAGAVVDQCFQEVAGVRFAVASDAKQILLSNADLVSHESIQHILEAVQPDGSISVSIDDLKTEVRRQNERMLSAMTDDKALLIKVRDAQADFPRYLHDEQRRQELKAIEEQHRQQTEQLKAEAANSAIYLTSTLFNLLGQPALGRAIGTVSAAILQSAQAFRQYTQTAAALGEIGSSLGAVVLTGNLVGAVMNIASIFGGPSTDQLILDAVNGLRNQMGEIRQEMHDRFNQIDRSLADLHADMDYQFARVLSELRGIDRDVIAVQRTLFQIFNNLDRLEATLVSLLRDGREVELNNALRSYLDQQGQVDLALSYEKFAEGYQALTTWAIDWATSATFAGLDAASAGDLADDQVVQQLRGVPLETRLNYLRDFAVTRLGLRSVQGHARLPNIHIWSIAAEGLARLFAENPAHVRRLPPSSSLINQAHAVGAIAEDFCTCITRNADGAPNREFLSALGQYYADKAGALHDAIDLLRERTLQQADRWVLDSTLLTSDDNVGPLPLDQGTTQLLASRVPPQVQAAARLIEKLSPSGLTYPPLFRYKITNIRWASMSYVNDPRAKDDCRFDVLVGWGVLAFDLVGTVYTTGANLGSDTPAYEAEIIRLEFQAAQRTEVSARVAHTEGVVRTEVGSVTPDGGSSETPEMHDPVGPPERPRSVLRNDCAQQGWIEGRVLKSEDPGQFLRSNWNASLNFAAQLQARLQQPDTFKNALTAAQVQEATVKVSDTGDQVLNILVGQNINRDTQMRALAASLDGARELLIAFLSVGLPRLIEQDDYVRSLLFADGALPDGEDVGQMFLPPASIVHDTHIKAREMTSRKAADLTEFMTRLGDALATRSHQDSPRELHSALNHLELCETLRT